MRRVCSLIAPAALLLASSVAAYAQAPHPLFNKTVQVSWTANPVETIADGQTITPHVTVNWTIFVSSAGRLFVRGARYVGRRGGYSDNAPGATTNKLGEATGVRFVGKRMIGNVAYTFGALNFIVTFDRAFSGCSVHVMYGREGGKMARRGVDGVMRQIGSVTTSGESCSIREGNAFAN
jgi:hypothetical protein